MSELQARINKLHMNQVEAFLKSIGRINCNAEERREALLEVLREIEGHVNNKVGQVDTAPNYAPTPSTEEGEEDEF